MSSCDDCGRGYELDPLHLDCEDNPGTWGHYATAAISNALVSLTVGRCVGIVNVDNKGATL